MIRASMRGSMTDQRGSKVSMDSMRVKEAQRPSKICGKERRLKAREAGGRG